jgi:hypothetical protein
VGTVRQRSARRAPDGRAAAHDTLRAEEYADPAANAQGMPRTLLGLSEPDLERALLRKGVGAREAGRRHCSDCGRTPLIGEQVHLYSRGAVVCDLCRPRRRQPPEGSQTVRHTEHGHTVRPRVRVAA